MSASQRVVVASFKCLTRLICRIDDSQLARIPSSGPLILVTNHVNILEIPIIYTHLKPRPVHGLVLADRWNNPILRWLLETCEAIPLRRREVNHSAFRQGLNLLANRHILIISPEGTRSGHGGLQKAYHGVVSLALHSGAPLLPVVYWGAEGYKKNITRFQRTDFHLCVGQPFHLYAKGIRVTYSTRLQMVNEIMYQLAMLLPHKYRGEYADISALTTNFLKFMD